MGISSKVCMVTRSPCGGYFRVGRVERRQRRGARRPPGRGGDKGGRRMALVTDGGGGQSGVSQAGSSGGRGDREVQ